MHILIPSGSTPSPSKGVVSSITCAPLCDLDVTGTILTYPGHISTTTIAIPTKRVDIYVLDNAPLVSSAVAYTTELAAPSSVVQTAPTWRFNTITLYDLPICTTSVAKLNKQNIPNYLHLLPHLQLQSGPHQSQQLPYNSW